jgi:predicted RNA binding protein YcfA (HicA-like mRNA interferase family)
LGRLNPQPFREIKRRLEAAGFVEATQKGSHVKFVRRSGGAIDTAIVPKKREIPVGTLRSILSQAHIEPDEWENLASSDEMTSTAGKAAGY